MSGPRIVIVTYDWPPRNAISIHRPYAWARYWSEAGAQVTVLTAIKQPFDEPLDLHMPQLQEVEVIEVPYGGGGRLTREALQDAELVLVMTETQKSLLMRAFPGFKDKVFTIGEFAGKDEEVSDPYGASLPVYRQIASQLREMVSCLVEKIK